MVIDKNQFHERLSSIITQLKADKRSGDQLYNGASSITIVMGKSDEASGFSKASAMQVRNHGRACAPQFLLTVCPSSGSSATSFHLRFS